jgi:hypothetical protein
MKPFDLEKALAGEPIYTRDGRYVIIAGINERMLQHCQLIGWINNLGTTWYKNGKHGSNTDYDLFMAEKPRVTGWICVFKERPYGYTTSPIYLTKEQADSAYRHIKHTTIKIEWEE